MHAVDSKGEVIFRVNDDGTLWTRDPVKETPQLNVLDKGYVRLVDWMGSDLSVVNAARVSYDKESREFSDKDEGLVAFLARERHTAPFRHAIAQYEVYAPLFVARQWWKHIIGGTHAEYPESQEFWAGLDPFLAWNESSRRYVTENEEFYLPGAGEWRKKPANSKQGSAGFMDPGPEPAQIRVMMLNYGWGVDLTSELERYQAEGVRKYEMAMEAGVAPEMARLFLPSNGLYVRWRWTTSLQGVMHFLDLRDDSHAQKEIQDYAKAVKTLTATRFPVSIGSLD